jgi:CDP-diacylglycerol--serine O-phosphatidyltransferase
MARSRTQHTSERLLKRVRRQRVKTITVLPSLITVLNGVCGFTAIIFASKGAQSGIGHISYFSLAGYMILFAMLADMLDGRLARMSQSTSSFGGQLDSLCDMVSFGVAPAFLMLKVSESTLSSAGLAGYEMLRRFIWLAAAAYISCAAIRLARFNVENEENESAHMSFVGLPSPAAAGVIVSLVILYQVKASSLSIIIIMLPFISLGVAVLMVSRIRYPHILNQYLSGKKPFAYLIRVLLFVGLVIWSMQAALAILFCVFAASSLMKWFYFRLVRGKSLLAFTAKQAATTVSEHTEINEKSND